MAALRQSVDCRHSQWASRVDLSDEEDSRSLWLLSSGDVRGSSCKGRWVFWGRRWWWYWFILWGWFWVILAFIGAAPSALVHLGFFASLCIFSWESICGFSFCTGHILDMRLIYLYIFLMHVDALFMVLYASLFMMIWDAMPRWCIVTLVCVFYIWLCMMLWL